MINFDSFYEQLIGSISNFVGCSLTTIKGPNGTTRPAVIRKRSNAPRPTPTFITVDVEDIWMPSGWVLNEELDQNNNPRYTILYEMKTMIECYGQDSKQILQNLNTLITLPNFRYRMKTQAGACVATQGAVRNIPKLLDTDFEERAELAIRWYIHDVVTDIEQCGTDSNTGYFDTVNGQGTYKSGRDGDDILVNFSRTSRT